MVTRCAGGRNQIQLASLLLKLFLCDCSLGLRCRALPLTGSRGRLGSPVQCDSLFSFMGRRFRCQMAKMHCSGSSPGPSALNTKALHEVAAPRKHPLHQ